MLVLVSGFSRNMAGKSKGGKNKGKAQGAGQSVSAEPEVPVTDGAEVISPENGEVCDPPAAEGGVADAEKTDGEAPVAAQPGKKPAEGEASHGSFTYSLMILTYSSFSLGLGFGGDSDIH